MFIYFKIKCLLSICIIYNPDSKQLLQLTDPGESHLPQQRQPAAQSHPGEPRAQQPLQAWAEAVFNSAPSQSASHRPLFFPVAYQCPLRTTILVNMLRKLF